MSEQLTTWSYLYYCSFFRSNRTLARVPRLLFPLFSCDAHRNVFFNCLLVHMTNFKANAYRSSKCVQSLAVTHIYCWKTKCSQIVLFYYSYLPIILGILYCNLLIVTENDDKTNKVLLNGHKMCHWWSLTMSKYMFFIDTVRDVWLDTAIGAPLMISQLKIINFETKLKFEFYENR